MTDLYAALAGASILRYLLIASMQTSCIVRPFSFTSEATRFFHIRSHLKLIVASSSGTVGFAIDDILAPFGSMSQWVSGFLGHKKYLCQRAKV